MQSTLKHPTLMQYTQARLRVRLNRVYATCDIVRAMKLYFSNNLNTAYNDREGYNPAIDALTQQFGQGWVAVLESYPRDQRIDILRGSMD